MWETLLNLVGDNSEAKAVINNLKNDVANKDAMISSLQTQFDNVKEEKERYKLGNQLVKQKLGLEKINEETITEKLSALGSKGDKAKELQELTAALAAKDDEIAQVTNEYNKKFDGMRIDMEISKAMESVSDVLADNPILRNAFRENISKNIGVVGDVIAPYTVVGDQRVPIVKGGEAVKVADYIKEVISGEEYEVFRKPKVPGGAGGAGGGRTDGSGNASFGGTPAERKQAIADMMAKG